LTARLGERIRPRMWKQANVTLLVSDMKPSIAFYRDVLGFKVAGEYGGEFAELDAPRTATRSISSR